MVTSAFFVKYTPADYFDTKKMGIRWIQVLNRYADKIKADYYRTTATWERHHPVFMSSIRYIGGNPRMLVYTDDQVYSEIDSGTSIRYATMTRDFEPKTKARILSSFPGKGKMAYYDTNVPRPGIEPRWFSDTITRKYEDDIIRDLDRATSAGLNDRLRSQ